MKRVCAPDFGISWAKRVLEKGEKVSSLPFGGSIHVAFYLECLFGMAYTCKFSRLNQLPMPFSEEGWCVCSYIFYKVLTFQNAAKVELIVASILHITFQIFIQLSKNFKGRNLFN